MVGCNIHGSKPLIQYTSGPRLKSPERSRGDPHGGGPPDQQMLVTQLPAGHCSLNRVRSTAKTSLVYQAWFQGKKKRRTIVSLLSYTMSRTCLPIYGKCCASYRSPPETLQNVPLRRRAMKRSPQGSPKGIPTRYPPRGSPQGIPSRDSTQGKPSREPPRRSPQRIPSRDPPNNPRRESPEGIPRPPRKPRTPSDQMKERRPASASSLPRFSQSEAEGKAKRVKTAGAKAAGLHLGRVGIQTSDRRLVGHPGGILGGILEVS